MTPVPIFVDTVSKLTAMLQIITDLPTSPPSLYLDLEGVNLGRNGTLSLITLYAHTLTLSAIYLIDVYTLKQPTFETSGPDGITLQSVLESPNIPKAIFDVRNDSDALYKHFNIKLQGVQDLQLMELATRVRPRDRISSLTNCIKYDLVVSHTDKKEWEKVKDVGKTWFQNDQGRCFEERPLRPEVEKYCVNDVVHMPKLWKVYAEKMDDFWWKMVRETSEARIRESQGKYYNPDGGREKALSPWSKRYVAQEKAKWIRENQ
ncbi:ribonuclease H-like domain-containing protein [Lophiotrema nucula]|uniref:Ribonuclease H-like domain-containing protein n=1 Tax=Lophiotrema nucula TaxID=690887 RepID=A0A6A5ZHT7_9PLEO|nr:ribonuclease H-like domain-containing protein [Lophiotrema nucula]